MRSIEAAKITRTEGGIAFGIRCRHCRHFTTLKPKLSDKGPFLCGRCKRELPVVLKKLAVPGSPVLKAQFERTDE